MEEKHQDGGHEDPLAKLLRDAGPELARQGPGPHPESVRLVAYAHDELAEDEARALRVHLYRCAECFLAVHQVEQILETEAAAERTEAGIAEGVWDFIFARLRPLAFCYVGDPQLALAAAAEDTPEEAVEVFENGGERLAAVRDTQDHLVVTYERTGHSGVGVEIEVVEIAPDGTETVRASARTDEAGDADLGPMAHFNPASRPGQYLVRVRSRDA
jgi:hypothetical protein